MIPAWARRILYAKDLDGWLLGATLALAIIGLIAVYSAGQLADSPGGVSRIAREHAVRLVLGLIFFALAATVPFRVFHMIAYPAYPLILAILALVPIAAAQGMRAESWLRVGPIVFEPSEFAKVAVVFALARYLSERNTRPDSLRKIIPPSLLAFVPVVAVALQPDLGSSVVLAGAFLPMLYWAGLPPLYLLLLATPVIGLAAASTLPTWVAFILFVVAVIWFGRLRGGEAFVVLALNLSLGMIAPMAWNHLKEYQQERVLTFLNPNRDPLGAGYQILQSKVALGSGGILGKGFLHGTQKALAFLPARHTDFIFSVVGEEFGFLGAGLVVVLFFVVVARGISLAGQARNRFASLLAIGITASLVVQAVVNIAVTMGLMPVTGITLPLMSYGGSSLVSTLGEVGVLLNVGMRRHEA